MTQSNIQYELALDDSLPELIDYSVRVSSRARNVSLRVLPVTGLEITIPRWFRRRDLPELISENREWIETQLAYIKEHTIPDFLVWPPSELNLRSHREMSDVKDRTETETDADDSSSEGLVLKIEYTASDGASGLSSHIEDGKLLLSGDVSNRQLVLRMLSRVLKQEADRVFRPQLEALAVRYDLKYKKMVIRGQRTLWGSYSSSGTLSLNFKLLFLPPELTRYVLLHELAHTRYLNHSASFWRCLSAMEPAARTLDRALNTAGDHVPPWLESVT